MKRLSYLSALLPLAAYAADGSLPTLRLAQIASEIPLITDIESPRDGTGRLFIVLQQGLIVTYKEGTLQPGYFLDIRDKTFVREERGLLGLAFPPGFAEKRYFYTTYVTPGDYGETRLARYRLADDSDIADPDSEEVILRLPQFSDIHKSGCIRFGPDGYLYLGLGDGGSPSDEAENAQNPKLWYGKILRIDTESGATPYSVPKDNPFVNRGDTLPEIWAMGLRNPWRFSFDRVTGDLYIGDVGLGYREEIDFQFAGDSAGHNYGWNIMEGDSCFDPLAHCDQDGLTLPIYAYGRDEGAAVIGGFVYRAAKIAGLYGAYIYGDFVTGRISALTYDDSGWRRQLLMETGLLISTFGEDEDGDLYVGDWDGRVFKIELELPPD
jgi:glucose/arabinose dehydrogenase